MIYSKIDLAALELYKELIKETKKCYEQTPKDELEKLAREAYSQAEVFTDILREKKYGIPDDIENIA